ncbi:MAG: cytochrome c3 family protein [Gallionella sp.]
MKTSITSIAKLAGGLTLMAASSFASASVVDTAHNLGSTNTSGGMTFSGTTEICIFCHTPHGGDQSVAAPIWNRTQSSTSVYTRFSAMNRITFDADEAPIGSVSIACLSCHDGTQARDAVINSPGSNSTGFVGDGAGTWMDGTTPATSYLSDLTASDNGTMGDMIYLGTDLRNDHPISMQYAGGGINSGATLGATRDPDFAQADNTTGGFGATAVSHATTSTNNNNGSGTGSVNYLSTAGGPKWYVDTGTAGYQGSDFPLYTRTDGLVATAQPYVECATCHDPHSANSTFLRLPGGNNGSQVCLTCHAK